MGRIEMKVDIIIPVYNAEAFLPKLFGSLLRQTYQKFHICVVDDCSTDNSKKVIQKYQKVFKDRLELIENDENTGPAVARNIALDKGKITGEYLLFLDCDDYFENNFIEKMVYEAETHNVDMVICGLDRIEEKSGRVLCQEMTQNEECVITDISQCEKLAYMVPVLWNKLFRRSQVGDVRFPNCGRSEDTVFIFQILPEMKRIKFTNDVLYHYVIRENSMTGDMTEEMYYSMLMSFRDLYSVYKNGGEKYRNYVDLLEVQIFIRCAIGGVYRRAFKNLKNTIRYERNAREYLDDVVCGWRKNRYLSLCHFYGRNLKMNAVSMCALLYKGHLFVAFVVCYWIINRVMRKEIRF